MREIKFRAWDVEREKFRYGCSNIMIDTGGCIMWQFAYNAPEPVPKDSFILQQFTGLLDKSGGEIYEGDIIEHDKGDVWVVKYEFAEQDGYASMGFQCFCKSEWPYIKVIGNIHQNPDLLDVSK